ncbi:serine/threonine protein kinase [Methylobacterium fujisawaense]|uniref:serine/threonine protein kinase n=1 Tax=Methylobacterium fujisawaense TaxID=107400 RepID=UPI00313C251B
MAMQDWTVQPQEARSGGQGSVAFVVHNKSGAAGALKRMHPETAKEKERRFRFYSEVGALKAMDGHGVPLVIESNEECFSDKCAELYLVMERIEGSNISDFISKHGNIELTDALIIINRVLEIVEEGHRLEIFHRDLKPDNIMLRGDDVSDPVIVDYGMSWNKPAHQEQNYKTPGGKELGNRFLRLPEYAPNGIHRDSRSDLTMLIGILFYLLVGKAPRWLVSELGLAPHDHLDAEMPEKLKNDERWLRLRSVFNIGFQHRIEMRFQTSEELRLKLKQVCADPPEPKGDEFMKELAAFREKIETIEAQRRQALVETMISASSALEISLRTAFEGEGFSVKGFKSNSRSGGTVVVFTIQIGDNKSGRQSGLFEHSMETDFINVQTSYRVDFGPKYDGMLGQTADFENFQRNIISGKEILMAAILRTIAV